MPISDVIRIEDGSEIRSHIKRGEKAFYGFYLEEGDSLALKIDMKGDITFKIFFRNRRLLLKTFPSGNHRLDLHAMMDGFYQCALETIEGANYVFSCEIKKQGVNKASGDSFVKKLSLRNLFVLLPLFLIPSAILFILAGELSLIAIVAAFLGTFLIHETTERKEVLLQLLYVSNLVFALLALFYVYFIAGWHDAERLLLVFIYDVAMLLVIAALHLFLKKILRYGK